MSTLRQRLALRYGIVVAACLGLLGWLTYHEFVREPALFREAGLAEPPGGHVGELTEVLIYAGVPVIFLVGWWLVRRSLRPIDELAHGVERFRADNLNERLPRSCNGDEVDRMAAAFNAMAARLEQSFLQIREFTLHASHELKTPLTVMRSQIETSLAQSAGLPEGQRAALDNLHEEVLRLAKIVDGLALLTKADSGLVALERQPVALAELVREAAEDAGALAHADRIQVRLTRCDAVAIAGDRHRLRQVLLNLVDNAVKYNQPGGFVELALQRQADGAELTVSNSGPGLAPELQARVFDRFVRGETSHGRVTEGCGLGLTIVKWIVEAHGGQVQFTSTPGTTTVVVRLPCLRQDG